MADEFGEIRVRDLRFFDRLASLGTITAAAKELGIPKPTASRWLAVLEQRVGQPLVRRTTRHAALTDEGRAFHGRVQGILASLQAVELSVAAEPSGTVRVSVPVPLGRMLGGEVIAGFRRKLPGVRLEIALQNRRIDLVRDRFDLAIRGGPLPDSELVARKLGRTALTLYASSDYADTALEDIPILGSPGDEKLLKKSRTKYGAPVVLVDDRGALADALIEGAGAGILPAFLGEPACARGNLIRLEKEPLAHMPVHALFLPAQREDPRLRVLIDEIARVLSSTLAAKTPRT